MANLSIGVDESYARFWKDYAKQFIEKLKENKFEMTSNWLINWTYSKNIPSTAIDPYNMSGSETTRIGYGRCVLYSTCTGTNNLFYKSVSVHDLNLPCLKPNQSMTQSTCEKEHLTLFEVTYIKKCFCCMKCLIYISLHRSRDQ